jgi:DNA-binding NarL/FixJ family response regulator
VRKELSTEADRTPGTTDTSIRGVSESLSVFGSVLSRRELEIAELVSHGATNRELAAKLYISESTVKVHLKNILQKLKLKNRQQLAVLAAAYLNSINKA